MLLPFPLPLTRSRVRIPLCTGSLVREMLCARGHSHSQWDRYSCSHRSLYVDFSTFFCRGRGEGGATATALLLLLIPLLHLLLAPERATRESGLSLLRLGGGRRGRGEGWSREAMGPGGGVVIRS